LSLFHKKQDNKDEEIMSMIDEYKEQGALDEEEAEMINNVIEWADSNAGDIMTNRALVDGVSVQESLKECLMHMLHGNNTRYPLYEDNLDNILGILYLKDVMLAYMEDSQRSLREVAREALYVPETLPLDSLFQRMRTKKLQMAIVVDEYGQNAGIVTMEDILEELVGDIQDEYDPEEAEAKKSGEDLIVDGSMTLEELKELVPIKYEEEDWENFDTVNGLLLKLLGHIPEDGETGELNYNGYSFVLLSCREYRIQSVRVISPKTEEN